MAVEIRKQRVAVIGSGMAGLTTAMLLNSDREGRYTVAVFESVGLTGPPYYTDLQ